MHADQWHDLELVSGEMRCIIVYTIDLVKGYTPRPLDFIDHSIIIRTYQFVIIYIK